MRSLPVPDRRFRAPRCSSFLPAPDAPIRRICARSDSMEELSYLHRPSLRRGIRDCAGHGRTEKTPWAVPGLPVPGGVTLTVHAYGGVVRRHCASLQLMKASIWEFEPSGEEPVAGLSLRAGNRCSPPWGEEAGSGVVRPAGGAWRAGQAREVCGVLAGHARRVWVAEAGGEPFGWLPRRAASRQRRGEIYVTQSIRRPGSAGRHGSDRGRHRLAAAVGAAGGGDRGWRPGARSCPAGLRGGRRTRPCRLPCSSGPCSGSRRRLAVTGLRFRRGRWRCWSCGTAASHAGRPNLGPAGRAGEGSHWAGLPGNGRQRAPGGYSTGPISAPASSA